MEIVKGIIKRTNDELRISERIFGAVGFILLITTIIGNYDIIDRRNFNLYIGKWILLMWIIVNLLLCIIYRNRNEKIMNLIKVSIVVVSCTIILYISLEYLNFRLTQLLFKAQNFICYVIMLVGCAFIVPIILTGILYFLPNIVSVILLNLFYTNRLDKKFIGNLEIPILHDITEKAIYLYVDMKLVIKKANTVAVTNDEKVQQLKMIKKEMYDFLNKEVIDCKSYNTLVTKFDTLKNIDLIYSKSKKYGQYLKKCNEKKKEILNLINTRFNYINKQIESAQIGNDGEMYVNKEMDKYEYI